MTGQLFPPPYLLESESAGLLGKYNVVDTLSSLSGPLSFSCVLHCGMLRTAPFFDRAVLDLDRFFEAPPHRQHGVRISPWYVSLFTVF